MGRNEHGRELALLSEYDSFCDKYIVLERVLNRLRSNEFTTRRFDQIFLTVGDGEEAVRVQVANITGFKPIACERIGCFVGAVPVALENGGSPDQNFTVFGNAHFNVGERLSDSADLVRRRGVYSDDRRRFRPPVSLMEANA